MCIKEEPRNGHSICKGPVAAADLVLLGKMRRHMARTGQVETKKVTSGQSRYCCLLLTSLLVFPYDFLFN